MAEVKDISYSTTFNEDGKANVKVSRGEVLVARATFDNMVLAGQFIEDDLYRRSISNYGIMN